MTNRPRLERASWIAAIVSAIIAGAALFLALFQDGTKVNQNAGGGSTQIGVVNGDVDVRPVSPPVGDSGTGK